MPTTLKERVDALERKVAELAETVAGPGKKDWRRTFGTSRSDAGFDEMIELGHQVREQSRVRDPDARS